MFPSKNGARGLAREVTVKIKAEETVHGTLAKNMACYEWPHNGIFR